MIRTKDINFISEALKFAQKHRSSRGYMMVAFLVQNKNLVSIGVNNYRKTHAKTIQTEDYIIPQHAELKCVSKWIVKNKKLLLI